MQSSPGCREERTGKDRSISITEKEYATGNEEVFRDHPAMRTVLFDMAEKMKRETLDVTMPGRKMIRGHKHTTG